MEALRVTHADELAKLAAKAEALEAANGRLEQKVAVFQINLSDGASPLCDCPVGEDLQTLEDSLSTLQRHVSEKSASQVELKLIVAELDSAELARRNCTQSQFKTLAELVQSCDARRKLDCELEKVRSESAFLASQLERAQELLNEGSKTAADKVRLLEGQFNALEKQYHDSLEDADLLRDAVRRLEVDVDAERTRVQELQSQLEFENQQSISNSQRAAAEMTSVRASYDTRVTAAEQDVSRLLLDVENEKRLATALSHERDVAKEDAAQCANALRAAHDQWELDKKALRALQSREHDLTALIERYARDAEEREHVEETLHRELEAARTRLERAAQVTKACRQCNELKAALDVSLSERNDLVRSWKERCLASEQREAQFKGLHQQCAEKLEEAEAARTLLQRDVDVSVSVARRLKDEIDRLHEARLNATPSEGLEDFFQSRFEACRQLPHFLNDVANECVDIADNVRKDTETFLQSPNGNRRSSVQEQFSQAFRQLDSTATKLRKLTQVFRDPSLVATCVHQLQAALKTILSVSSAFQALIVIERLVADELPIVDELMLDSGLVNLDVAITQIQALHRESSKASSSMQHFVEEALEERDKSQQRLAQLDSSFRQVEQERNSLLGEVTRLQQLLAVQPVVRRAEHHRDSRQTDVSSSSHVTSSVAHLFHSSQAAQDYTTISNNSSSSRVHGDVRGQPPSTTKWNYKPTLGGRR